MSGFNWEDHPVVGAPGEAAQAPEGAKQFSWNDHPVVDHGSDAVEEKGLGTGDFSVTSLPAALFGLFGGSREAVGQKAMDAATMGHLPQLSGAASLATGGGYLSARDARVRALESMAKNNPISSGAGTVAGMTASLPIAESAVSELAPAALTSTKIRKAMAIGGLIGGVENPGDVEGKIAPIQPVDRLENAAIGAGVGGALESVPGVAKYAGGKAKKLASTLSGIPEGAIDTYAKHGKEVDALISKYGENIADASDAIKSKWNRAVEIKKSALSSAKDSILSAADSVKVSAKPIFEQLENARESINPDLYPEAHDAIKKIQDKIAKTLGGLEGTPAQIEEVKTFLQGEAKPSYLKGGQIFAGGDKAEKAAKQAASTARKLVNDAVPEVGKINNEWQLLFDTQAKMNKNLLKEGGSEAAIMSAGNGTSPRNAKMLQRLGGAVGHDMAKDAELLAAQKEFANPGWLPRDFTGKSLARMIPGMAAGHAVLGPVGSVVGAAMTSPAAVKQALRLKALMGPLAEGVADRIPSMSPMARAALEDAAPQAGAESGISARKKLSRKARIKAIGD